MTTDYDVPVDGPFVRSAFNYDRNIAGDNSGLNCKDVSLAKQEFAEESDINTIVRRFNATGEVPNVRAPEYGDFTGIGSFHEAVNAIAAANESFDSMPAEVRARFNNDVAGFVDFCANPANVDEMKKLGLTKAPLPVKVDMPLKVEVVNSYRSDDDGRSQGGSGGTGLGAAPVAAKVRGNAALGVDSVSDEGSGRR